MLQMVGREHGTVVGCEDGGMRGMSERVLSILSRQEMSPVNNGLSRAAEHNPEKQASVSSPAIREQVAAE